MKKPTKKLGQAIAGICLIRLEHIRPQIVSKVLPQFIGISSENAAHRIAVLWDEDGQTREGVFIPRCDTSSQLNHLAGGRIFPGEYQKAAFNITETDSRIALAMRSDDGSVAVEIEGEQADDLPPTSIFPSLAEASAFFEAGSLGYSVTSDGDRLDGLQLQTREWRVEPLHLTQVHSSYFADEEKFPKGSVTFDHALIMRNVAHEWHTAAGLRV